MKRGLSFVIATMMLIVCSLTSFADMGYPVAPNIEEFEAYVGLDGFTAVNHWGGNDLYVPAGTHIRVFYKNDDGTYMFYGSGPNKEPIEGDNISPDNLSTGYQVVAPKETPDKKVTVSVTPDVGINLRCGPSTNYPSFTTIKKGVKLEYTSVFSNEGMDWGYTQYNGQAGWVSLKYTAVVTTTEKPTETTTKSAQTQPDTQPNTTAEPSDTVTAGTKGHGRLGTFLGANNTVVICMVVAVILALVSIVLILYIFKVKKRNENLNINNESAFAQGYVSSGDGAKKTLVVEEQEKPGETQRDLCPYCGAALVKGGKFCSACGKPLEENVEDDPASTE